MKDKKMWICIFFWLFFLRYYKKHAKFAVHLGGILQQKGNKQQRIYLNFGYEEGVLLGKSALSFLNALNADDFDGWS